MRWTYRQQKIVALNPQDVAYLESVLPTKVILINGEGYDFNNISFFEKKNSSSIVIAYAGRLLKSKGVDKLVEAFIQLSDFNCELRLIGDFDFSNSDAVSAEWLAEMQSISNNRIHCYGFVDNAREMLKEVDIYISLSDREGLPFSVLEAIEAGCLIVLSSVPGHLSFVDLNGILLVEIKNLKLLLEDILNNPIEYFNFDVFERLKISNARFGMKNIISEIKSKIL